MKTAMRSRRMLAILAFAVLLAVPALAHPVRQQAGPRERLAERLNLTQEQRDRLRDLRRDGRREAVLRRGEMASLRARIRAEFLKDDLDAAAVRSLSAELGKLAGEAAEARLGGRLAFLEVLTPEQRQELQDLRARRHERRQGFHRGPGQRRGRGA